MSAHQLLVVVGVLPDGPDVQPEEVGGGEGVQLGGQLQQVGLLVPDPVQLPAVALRHLRVQGLLLLPAPGEAGEGGGTWDLAAGAGAG